MRTTPRLLSSPLPALIVIAGSCLLSALYYSTFVYAAGYSTNWKTNLAMAVLAGIIAAALDALKPRLFGVASQHWRNQRKRMAIAPAMLAFLLAVISMIAIDGMLLKLRVDGTSSTTHTISQWERTSASLRKAEAELKALAPSRPVAEISAAMGKVRIDIDTLRRTNHCQPDQVTREDSRKACLPLMELHQEQARANRKERLEQTIMTATAWLDANPRPASADPQIELYAKLTGQPEGSVALVMVLLVGLALELCALFGPALLAPVTEAVEAQPRSEAVPPAEPAIDLIAESRFHEPLAAVQTPKLLAFQPRRARRRSV